MAPVVGFARDGPPAAALGGAVGAAVVTETGTALSLALGAGAVAAVATVATVEDAGDGELVTVTLVASPGGPACVAAGVRPRYAMNDTPPSTARSARAIGTATLLILRGARCASDSCDANVSDS